MAARRAIPRPRRARAFTLIEAVIAMVILATLAVVCLQLRADAASRARRLSEARRGDDTARLVLDLAARGLLPGGVGPERGDPALRVVWRGEHEGAHYTCTRELVRVPNPSAGAVGAASGVTLARELALFRYTASCEGVEQSVYLAGMAR